MSFPLEDARSFLSLIYEIDKISLGYLKNVDHDGNYMPECEDKVKDLEKKYHEKAQQYISHPYVTWIRNQTPFIQAIRKHFSKSEIIDIYTGDYNKATEEKRPRLYSDHSERNFVRNITECLVEYYEREENKEIIQNYVLTKKKKNKMKKLAYELYNDINNLPTFMNLYIQINLDHFLHEFIERINNIEQPGFAISRNHNKANREILIKELIFLYAHTYPLGIIPADVISEIASIVDPEVTERIVYRTIKEISPNIDELVYYTDPDDQENEE